MSFVEEVLPAINACLNATSGILVFSAWRAIKAKNVPLHKNLMLAACGSSTLFLAGYLTRVALAGVHRFPGDGTALKSFYLALLGSHTLLAVASLPLVLRTLYLGLNSRFVDHKQIARWTFPVWTYVSATGVLVYFMLYQLAPRLHDAVAMVP